MKNLGLAAYIRMHGEPLIEITQNREFIFNSWKPLEAWSIEYANSECSRHDNTLCELRRLLKTT